MHTQNQHVPNNFDAHSIFQALNQEIRKDRWVVFLLMLLFIAITLLLFPIAFLWFARMVAYTDLPMIDYHLTFIFSNSKFVLMPYSLVLLFYFYAASSHTVNKKHDTYKKAKFFLIASLVAGCFPFLWYEYRFTWSVIYVLFFMVSLYYLSMTYLKHEDAEDDFIPMRRDSFIHSEYLGIYGFMDDPFRISDDINRAKLAIATTSAGFTFIEMFTEMVFKSWIYFRATGHKKYIFESALFLDALFENKMNQTTVTLSNYAKTILSYKGYIIFSPRYFEVTNKSKDLALKAESQRKT